MMRRTRGLGKIPAKVHVTLRLPKHVVDHYGGDIKLMRDEWVRHVESLTLPE